jgi:hypothetical protein
MDHEKQNSNQIPIAFSSSDRQNTKKANSPALNQHGSALLICLSTIPLLLSALIASLCVVWFLDAKNELLFLCEKSLLETQNQLVNAENKLLRINRSIENLVHEKKILKKALILSTTPADRALLKAQLIKIEIKLAFYKKEQTLLILKAQTRAQTTIRISANEIKKRLNTIQKQWSTHLWVQVKPSNPLMALEPVRIDPSGTIYRVPAQFEKKQTQNLRWSLLGLSLFPSWVQFLQSNKFFWQDSCSSRPYKKENNIWTFELGAGTS